MLLQGTHSVSTITVVAGGGGASARSTTPQYGVKREKPGGKKQGRTNERTLLDKLCLLAVKDDKEGSKQASQQAHSKPKGKHPIPHSTTGSSRAGWDDICPMYNGVRTLPTLPARHATPRQQGERPTQPFKRVPHLGGISMYLPTILLRSRRGTGFHRWGGGPTWFRLPDCVHFLTRKDVCDDVATNPPYCPHVSKVEQGQEALLTDWLACSLRDESSQVNPEAGGR